MLTSAPCEPPSLWGYCGVLVAHVLADSGTSLGPRGRFAEGGGAHAPWLWQRRGARPRLRRLTDVLGSRARLGRGAALPGGREHYDIVGPMNGAFVRV